MHVKINRGVEITILEDKCHLCVLFSNNHATQSMWHGYLKTLLKSPVRMLRMVGSYLSLPPGGSTDDRKGISCVEEDRGKPVVRTL